MTNDCRVFKVRSRCVVWARRAVAAAAFLAVVSPVSVANADPFSDSFLSTLSGAGVGFTDGSSAVSMGQSICPLLAQPGADFAKAASTVSGVNGISPDMAGMFTTVAITMYCPSMLSSFSNGGWLGNLSIPGR